MWEGMVNEQEFLQHLYRESGDQVRNMNALKNTYLSMFVVGIAAFIAVLSPSSGSSQLDKDIWWIVVAFAVIGVVGIAITWDYTQRSLSRQRCITQMILSPEIFQSFRFQELDTRPVLRRLLTFRWWLSHRLDLWPFLIYTLVGGFAFSLALRGGHFLGLSFA